MNASGGPGGDSRVGELLLAGEVWIAQANADVVVGHVQDGGDRFVVQYRRRWRSWFCTYTDIEADPDPTCVHRKAVELIAQPRDVAPGT